MYGLDDLKPTILVTEDHVECPVKGCSRQVVRQREVFRKKPEFYCPEHDIHISRSTFEYGRLQDALLYQDEESLKCVKRIIESGCKAESRMKRDNSEDAATWNVFSALDRYNLTSAVLAHLLKVPIEKPKMIFWSCDENDGERVSTWRPLAKARVEFAESGQGTEPDLILLTDQVLIFVEAKVTAPNKVPSTGRIEKHLRSPKKYPGGWFEQIFVKNTSFDQLVRDQKYELMRNWILGSWIAKSLGRSFVLVNLVREKAEQDIEQSFGRYLNQQPDRRFKRMCWEEIFRDPLLAGTPEAKPLLNYAAKKTVGYNGKHRLVKAFNFESA